MLYLTSFHFPTDQEEANFLYPPLRKDEYGVPRPHYMMKDQVPLINTATSGYPFDIFPLKKLNSLHFTTPIAILYGTNGSGKTTALQVIAKKLQLLREPLHTEAPLMDAYVALCSYSTDGIPPHSKLIASDDVFNYMLTIRATNQQIDVRRKELFSIYNGMYNGTNNFLEKYADDTQRLELYEQLQPSLYKSKSQFVKKNLAGNMPEHSNGENAIIYFEEKIEENALYLLDEPENSLSPEKQLQLAKYIEASARGCGCQFIIATHSPFLLAMNYATVYDLDEVPVCKKKWTDLKNVRHYWEFFMAHKDDF